MAKSFKQQEIPLLKSNAGANLEGERNHQLQTYWDRDGKVVCLVKCSVINVGDIDTVKQEFEVDFFFSAAWREPKFDGRRKEDIKANEYWDPRVYFPNAVTIDERSRTHDVKGLYQDNEAYAYLNIRMRGTFKTTMELQKFPFDYQELTIKVASNWRKEYFEFRRMLTNDGKIMDNAYLDSFTGEHEWNLPKHIQCPEKKSADSTENTSSAQEANLPATDGGQRNTYTVKGSYPSYYIKLHAQRRPSYYLWNVVVPVICILALTFTSFVIDADDPSGRLGVTVTMLLTAVAFKSVVSSMLPRISYLTILDEWLLFNFVWQCLIVSQNAVIGVSWWNENTRTHVDRVSGILLGVVAVVANIGFCGVGRYQYIKAKKKLAKITKEYKDNRPSA